LIFNVWQALQKLDFNQHALTELAADVIKENLLELYYHGE
jgi:hypothetical protein